MGENTTIMNIFNEESFTYKPKVTLIKSIQNILPLGAMLHILFLILFYVTDVKPLVYFNTVSVLLYLFIYFFLIKKHFFISNIIIFCEIILHSTLCAYLLGWSGGFYVYPLCLLPIAYFVSMNLAKKQIYGHIIAIIIVINYEFWNIYSNTREAPYETVLKNIDGILYNINTLIASFILVVLLYSVLYEMRYIQETLVKRNKILYNMANFDTMTQLKNRRCMLEHIKAQIYTFEKTNKGFFIAIGDIDKFKNFNDTYGHDCGDLILKEVAGILISNSNDFDIEVSRWGGEEFLILIKYDDIYKANEICQKILQDIRELKVPYKNEILNVTITIGCSAFDEKISNLDSVLKQADLNLYEGKQTTRNCVVIK